MHPKQKQLQEEHILVCLSTAPSNEKNIRTAAQMAKAFHGQFTALFVETPDYSAVSAENKNRLQNNCHLAEQLGATVIRIYGEDIAYQIATFAQLSNVSKIVLGRSTMTRKHLFGKPTLSEQLLSYAPELEIYIIPDQSGKSFYRPKKALGKHIWKDTLHSIGFLSGATVLGLLFHTLGFTEANIIMVYILAVLLTSVTTSHRIYSLTASISSAGATIPLSGFGHLLMQGVIEAVGEEGLKGVFTGGLSAASFGITVAMLMGFTMALIFQPKG